MFYCYDVRIKVSIFTVNNLYASKSNMDTQEIIGRTITNILVWSKIQVGGLDEAEISIELDNMHIIRIPWDFDSTNIETEPNIHSVSLFASLDETYVHSVNPENKTIGEIQKAKKKRDSSLIGRIKRVLRINSQITNENN